MKVISFLFTVFLGTVFLSCSTKEKSAYELKNGLLVFEIESLPDSLFAKDKWELATEFPGFSGSSYAIWKGKAIWGNESQPDDDPKRYLKFDVKIADPGTYYVKLKNYHNKVDGDNDVFVKTPGFHADNYLKYYDHDEKAWTLDETGTWAAHVFEPGTYTFEIAGRSHGFAIDQVVVYKEGTLLPQTPVNPNASDEAKELLSYLYQIRGNGILSGIHNDLKEPHKWDDSLMVRNDGVLPAIWGGDFRYGEHVEYRERMIDEAIRQHKENGRIITLMYHQTRPMDEEDCCGHSTFKESVQGDISEAEMDSLLIEGTQINQQWKKKWDAVAEYLQKLEDAKVPVLFRPYHEMNGEWFWWGGKAGKKEEGKEERDMSKDKFKELYKMTFNYLTHEKALNNLIWVLNFDDVNNDVGHYYPGDNYVDVLATDVYRNQHSEEHYVALQKLAGEKPIALGEISTLPSVSALKTTYKDFVWFMGWRDLFMKDFNDKNEGHSNDELKEIFKSDYVINAEDLKISENL